MENLKLRIVDEASSVAFDASCQLDEFKLELEAVNSTALLLTSAELLDERAQDAFRGIANALDLIIDRMSNASDSLARRSGIESASSGAGEE